METKVHDGLIYTRAYLAQLPCRSNYCILTTLHVCYLLVMTAAHCSLPETTQITAIVNFTSMEALDNAFVANVLTYFQHPNYERATFQVSHPKQIAL